MILKEKAEAWCDAEFAANTDLLLEGWMLNAKTNPYGAFQAGYRAALRDVREKVDAIDMPNVAIMFMTWLEGLEK